MKAVDLFAAVVVCLWAFKIKALKSSPPLSGGIVL